MLNNLIEGFLDSGLRTIAAPTLVDAMLAQQASLTAGGYHPRCESPSPDLESTANSDSGPTTSALNSPQLDNESLPDTTNAPQHSSPPRRRVPVPKPRHRASQDTSNTTPAPDSDPDPATVSTPASREPTPVVENIPEALDRKLKRLDRETRVKVLQHLIAYPDDMKRQNNMALNREAMEELGLDVGPEELLGITTITSTSTSTTVNARQAPSKKRSASSPPPPSRKSKRLATDRSGSVPTGGNIIDDDDDEVHPQAHFPPFSTTNPALSNVTSTLDHEVASSLPPLVSASAEKTHTNATNQGSLEDDRTAKDTRSPPRARSNAMVPAPSESVNKAGWPLWVHDAWNAFSQQSHGPEWLALIKAWTELEQTYGFDSPVSDQFSNSCDILLTTAIQMSGLGAINVRPPAVQWWVSRRRRYDRDPPIESSSTFGSAWWVWWDALNPDWRNRVEGHLERVRMGTGAELWTDLVRPGKNGLLSIVACLWWWGKIKASDDAEWEEAVQDVLWVVRCLALVVASDP